MNLIRKLWSDENGVILSAEAALVGTVAVIGLSTGLSVVARSVNEELKDVGFAIRSLDQSYSIPGTKGCCASTAGSCFQQQDVKKSLEDLCDVGKPKRHEDHKKEHDKGMKDDSESQKKSDHRRKSSKSKKSREI